MLSVNVVACIASIKPYRLAARNTTTIPKTAIPSPNELTEYRIKLLNLLTPARLRAGFLLHPHTFKNIFSTNCIFSQYIYCIIDMTLSLRNTLNNTYWNTMKHFSSKVVNIKELCNLFEGCFLGVVASI